MLPILLFSAALASSPYSTCIPKIDADPLGKDGYSCVYNEVRRTGEFDPAITLLKRYVEADHERHWARLTLANTMSAHDDDGCLEHYTKAQEGFARTGIIKGQVFAHLGMRNRLSRLGRGKEAEAELRKAVEAARASGDKPMVVLAEVELARDLWRRGACAEAIVMAEAVQADAKTHGSGHVNLILAHTLAAAYLELGRVDEAWTASQQALALTQDQGNRFDEATERVNMLELLHNHPYLAPGWNREKAHQFSVDSLELAIDVGNQFIVAAAHYHVGVYAEDVAAKRASFEAAVAASDATEGLYERGLALTALALLDVGDHPERALGLADQAVETGRLSGSRWDQASARQGRAQVLAAMGDVVGADAEFSKVLDLVEQSRDLQTGELARAGHQGVWGDAYLEAGEYRLKRGDLEGAWALLERRRGRVLLSAMDQVGVGATVLARHPERAELLKQIHDLEESLWEPHSPEEREAVLSRLAQREREEALLRIELADTDPDFAAAFSTSTPTLAMVQAALKPDQALLAFQLPNYDLAADGAGHSWLIEIDREGTQAHALQIDPRVLEQQIALFTGMIHGRNGEGSDAAKGLYERLFGQVQTEASSWVIAPDGPLYRLPFAALIPVGSDEPLMMTHQLSITGSAAQWLELGGKQVDPPTRSGLVIADPAFQADMGLERLPWASAEGRGAAALYGESATLLLGESATIEALKAAGPSDYGVVHFAAHAVVDHDPKRSALLLAPGPTFGGRLTADQIASLDFDGRAVILAVCSSEGGPIVGTEGVFGLGRAFFHAGARTVLASSWRLQDDEAAALFGGVSERLARGASMSEALTGAQREQWELGLPAAAWAGVYVLGDGDLVPIPEAMRSAGWPDWLWLRLMALLGGLALGGFALSRRS